MISKRFLASLTPIDTKTKIDEHKTNLRDYLFL